MTLNLDLADPAVEKLLGKETPLVQTPTGPKRMVQIAGDMDSGMSSTTRLDLGKHEVGVLIGWNAEQTSVVDVYAIPNEPVKVHLICPRCHHRLTVNGDRKKIEWDPTTASPVGKKFATFCPQSDMNIGGFPGVLSVEEFQCTWELSDEKHDTNKDTSLYVKGSLCRFRGVIEKNILREV